FMLGVSSLSGQNLLQNASFETGMLAPWFGDNDSDVTIVADSVDGAYSAIGNAAQNVDLMAGVNYELRCKAKILASPNSERVWIGVAGADGLVQNSEIFSSDYEDMAIDFTVPETGSYKVWIWGQGESSYQSDAWTLVVEGTSPTTSVNDELAKANIKIHNTLEGIAIKLTNNLREANIMVRNIAGQEILKMTTAQSQVFLDNNRFPAAGVFVISVQTGDLHRVEQVMITGN
ncbi:MAG: hypothetical protein AAFV07_10270, partial [Bacteroidota bacterium]